MTKKLITEVVHKSTSKEVSNSNNIDYLGEQNGSEQDKSNDKSGTNNSKK